MKVAQDPRAKYERHFGNLETTIPDAVYRAVAEDYIGRFYRLLEEWRSATRAMSFIGDKVNHPAFTRIVQMGDPIISLIVTELRTKPDFLFLALQEIVGEEVVPPAAIGDPKAMVEAWINWGERTLGHAD